MHFLTFKLLSVRVPTILNQNYDTIIAGSTFVDSDIKLLSDLEAFSDRKHYWGFYAVPGAIVAKSSTQGI